MEAYVSVLITKNSISILLKMLIPFLELTTHSTCACWRQIFQHFGFEKWLLAGGDEREREGQDCISGRFTRVLRV